MKVRSLILVMVCMGQSITATQDDFDSHGAVKTILNKEIRVFLGVAYARPPKGKSTDGAGLPPDSNRRAESIDESGGRSFEKIRQKFQENSGSANRYP